MEIKRNPIQERMFYLRSVQIHILDSLYADAEKNLEKAMWHVAEENQVLLKVRTPTFVYDGRWWPVANPPEPTKCNRLLHQDLYGKVQDLLDSSDFKDQEMRSGIETLIGNFLSVSGHVEDLDRLLPESIQATMPAVNTQVFNIAEPLPDAQIKDLLAVNDINARYLKRLLMTQLLLAKV